MDSMKTGEWVEGWMGTYMDGYVDEWMILWTNVIDGCLVK